MRSDAKNLKVITKAIAHHDKTCEGDTVGIGMNPFEVDRLGWDDINGIPIVKDNKIGTGIFHIICSNDSTENIEEDVVEAISTTERDLVTV